MSVYAFTEVGGEPRGAARPSRWRKPRPALAELDAARPELEERCVEPLVLEALSRRAIALGEADALARLCEERGLEASFEHAQALRFAGRGKRRRDSSATTTGGPSLPRGVVRGARGGRFPRRGEPRTARRRSFIELAPAPRPLPPRPRPRRALPRTAGGGQDLAYRALALPGIDDSVDVPSRRSATPPCALRPRAGGPRARAARARARSKGAGRRRVSGSSRRCRGEPLRTSSAGSTRPTSLCGRRSRRAFASASARSSPRSRAARFSSSSAVVRDRREARRDDARPDRVVGLFLLSIAAEL